MKAFAVRAWDWLRSHPLLALARFLWLATALIILGWGAHQRFQLPLEPLVDADFYGYLNPAMSKLTGGVFQHSIAREFLYPAFILFDLFVFNDFRAIAISQHWLGVATGALLLAAWQELLALRGTSRPDLTNARAFFRAALRQSLGLIVALLYLGRRAGMLSEHTVRPEAIFPFFAVLNIWLNLRFIRLRWIERRSAAAWRMGAAQMFVSCVLLMLRPSFALGAVFANVPLAIALCTRGERWAERLRPLGIGFAVVVLLLFLPESHFRAGDRLATTLLPSMRLLVHANLVLRQLDADLNAGNGTPYETGKLRAFRDRLAGAFARSQQPANNPWARLGFNPDYIYLNEDVFEPIFPSADPDNDRPAARFCNYFVLRTAFHQPVAMAEKICAQLSFLYSFDDLEHFAKTQVRFPRWNHGARQRLKMSDPTLYPLAVYWLQYAPFRHMLDQSAAGQRYLKRCLHLAQSGQSIAAIPWIRFMDELAKAAYVPLLLLTLAASFWIFAHRECRANLGLQALVALLLYSYNFGACLTIAIAFYLGQPRYLEMQEAFTLLSEAAAVLLLGRCAAVAALSLAAARSSRLDGSLFRA